MEQKPAVALLQAMTLLQSVILSCVDRKTFHFTKTQLSIFTVLDLKGELTMKQVSQYIASSQEQATRAVAPLADAGYVERRTDPANRTRVYICLTEAGKQIMEENRTMLTRNLTEKLDQSLEEEEKSDLYHSVTEIVSLMEKIK